MSRGRIVGAVAIAGALVLLVAVEASVAFGYRAARDTARLVLAVPLAVAAAVAGRAGARSEAIGLALASACLALAAGLDAAGARWIKAGGGEGLGLRSTVLRLASPWVVLGVPTVVGLVALRIPPARVFGSTVPRLRVLALAAALGAALFPVLSAATVYGNHAVRVALAAGTTAAGPGRLPPLAAVLGHPFFPESYPNPLWATALRLGVYLPLAEAFLHGVLRQAFLRWGRVPFVTGTAFLALPLVMGVESAFGVYLGMLVTGTFAARTGSALPGIPFWYGLFAGQTLLLRLAS